MAAEFDSERSSSEQRFGSVVRQLREERRLSQEGLAEASDLNRSFVGEIERGLAQPSLATIFKIASGLRMMPSRLIAHCERPTQDWSI